jgi:DNA polymerase-3 subunit epsilon
MDCDLLSKVYINLIDQKEPSLNFQNQEDNTNETGNFNISYFKKIILPTDTEIKNHKEYLKVNLKKNFY